MRYVSRRSACYVGPCGNAAEVRLFEKMGNPIEGFWEKEVGAFCAPCAEHTMKQGSIWPSRFDSGSALHI